MDKLNFDELVPKLDSDAFETVPQEIGESPSTEEKIITTPNEEEVEVPALDEQEEKNIKTKPTEEPTPEPDEAATLFYQELVQRGIATEQEDKEEYSWEDVESTLESYQSDLPKQVTENIINSTPDVARQLIDYVFTKGDALTKDDLGEFMNQYISDLNEQSTEFNDLDQAKSFLSKTYKEQGIRDTQIEVMLDALEDEGESAIMEEANKYKEKALENARSKQMLEQSKQERQQLEEQNKQFASTVVEELQNTGWKPQRLQKIQQDLSTGRTNEVLSKAFSSPKSLIQLANLATYYNEKTGEFNFDDFVKQVVTPQAKSLKDKISKEMFSTGTKTKEKYSNPNKDKYSDLVPHSPI